MTFSRFVDWSDEFQNHPDRWENLGRQALEEGCTHKTQDTGPVADRETNMRYSGYCEECDAHEDSAIPMMNYAYPLHCHYDLNDPEDLKKILRVVNETCLTVMYNDDEDTYYLTLCGGGMNLSQSIAYAYFIMERWIPYDLLIEVSTQPELSVYGPKWLKLAREIRAQLLQCSKIATRRRKEFAGEITRYKIILAKRKDEKKGVA